MPADESGMSAQEIRELDEDMGSDMASSDFSQNVPRNPGPAALGHTPLIGTVRRDQGIPVARERVIEELDELDAIDIRDSPLLPVLNTR